MTFMEFYTYMGVLILIAALGLLAYKKLKHHI